GLFQLVDWKVRRIEAEPPIQVQEGDRPVVPGALPLNLESVPASVKEIVRCWILIHVYPNDAEGALRNVDQPKLDRRIAVGVDVHLEQPARPGPLVDLPRLEAAGVVGEVAHGVVFVDVAERDVVDALAKLLDRGRWQLGVEVWDDPFNARVQD